MKYDFSFNGKIIPCEIICKDVKNVNIRVKPSGDVTISHNCLVDNKTIELLLIKKARWLISKIENYKANYITFNDGEHKLVDGEEFLLLGKILRVKNVYGKKFNVDFDNNYLYIFRQTVKQGIKTKFNEWYKNFVVKEFNNQVNLVFEKFKKYNIDRPTVVYKKMKTQWGSCNTDKRIITLNVQLVKVDTFLTEYVICHELVHLLYKHHDNNFYSFLTSLIPDWKQRENNLNNIFITNIGGK